MKIKAKELLQNCNSSFLEVFLAEFRPDSYQHSPKAGQSANEIGDGFCQEDSVDTQSEEIGEKENQRDDNDDFSENGEKHRVFSFS